ncbi:MAG: hypothetical protein KDC87_02680, partial [Planctomycetes bacterium]|nr:hypothetical protein [Planctomycetota bacterium]
MGGRDSAGRGWWTALVLVLAGAVFAPSLGNGFAMDDAPLASSRWVLVPGQPDPVIAEWHAPSWFFGKFYWFMEYVNDGLYRPLTILSYAWTYHLVSKPFFSAASEALPHHAINVLLHVLGTFGVLAVLRRLGAGAVAAHVGAAVFAVHAIHSEVVAGVVGRAELLAFTLGLGGILLFHAGAAARGGGRHLWWGASAVLLFGAYSAKESALGFAPLLLCFVLAERWCGGDRSVDWRTLGAAAATATAPLAVFLVLRNAAVANHPVDLVDYVSNPLWHQDATTRLSTAIKLWGYGLLLCVAPFSLRASYAPGVLQLESSPWSAGVLLAFALLAGLLWCGLRFARRRPLVFFGMTCLLGLPFITSNIPFATGTIFAERLLYAPSLGISVLAALWVDAMPRQRWVPLALFAWCAASAVVAWQRNSVWRDSDTLFLSEAERQPGSADMLVKAAKVLAARKAPDDHRRALAYLERALALVDGYPHALRLEAELRLGDGGTDAAIRCLQKARDSNYRELDDARALTLLLLGKAWLKKGDASRAVAAAERAVAMA